MSKKGKTMSSIASCDSDVRKMSCTLGCDIQLREPEHQRGFRRLSYHWYLNSLPSSYAMSHVPKTLLPRWTLSSSKKHATWTEDSNQNKRYSNVCLKLGAWMPNIHKISICNVVSNLPSYVSSPMTAMKYQQRCFSKDLPNTLQNW